MKPDVWSWKGTRPLTGWRSMLDHRIPWTRVDWGIVLLAGALVATSVVFVHAMATADLKYGRDDIVFAGHVRKLVVAAPFLVVGLLLRPRWLRKNAPLLFAACVLLLLLVPLIGDERNNARRWIQLPLGFDLQPSEPAKIGLILVLARSLYRNRLERLRDWVLPALLALTPMALVAAQPDLGTALTVVPVTLGMLWFAGARGRVLGGLVLVGVLFAGLAWQLQWVHGYQAERVEVWARCFEAPTLIEERNGAAYHAYHARVAIGDGGLTGTGLGSGVANEAGHLPERESDSIFAVIAEEGGFLGASLLVTVYLLFCAFLVAAAARTRERFSRLVVAGVAFYFAAHFFINVGVNLGLLPMTGLTLPLVSTGGSSLMASLAALGLALGLSARREPSLDLDAFRT